MKKWTLLDESPTPDGQRLGLYEHDGHYVIRVGTAELMSTRRHASEERMAELAGTMLAGKRRSRLLIGGLGFGFTLRAALAHTPEDSQITVAELFSAVVAWNQNPAYPLAAAELASPRVKVITRDVATVITSARAAYDVILLDVDNGPAGLTQAKNDGLYDEIGLHQIRAALRPGGSVIFWSAAAAPLFAKLLGRIGFHEVRSERARAHTSSGGWHTLFIATV